MEPLSPRDPLYTLLGRVRPVEPRPHFTQDVMRAVRQTPQRQTLWERMGKFFELFTSHPVACATAGAAVVALLGIISWPESVTPSTVTAANPAVSQAHLPAVVDEMLFSVTENTETSGAETAGNLSSHYSEMDPMGLLLVQEDTSALTDSEIALLVY